MTDPFEDFAVDEIIDASLEITERHVAAARFYSSRTEPLTVSDSGVTLPDWGWDDITEVEE